jgi:hypothetical protein
MALLLHIWIVWSHNIWLKSYWRRQEWLKNVKSWRKVVNLWQKAYFCHVSMANDTLRGSKR